MFICFVVVTRALKVRARVEESFLRGGLGRPTPTALSGMAGVTDLDGPFAAPQRPVAPQTRQDTRQRGQTAPTGSPLVRAATAGVVRARHIPITLRIVVEQGLDTAQTGRVVDDRVRTEEAGLAAHPTRGQGSGQLAGFTPDGHTNTQH